MFCRKCGKQLRDDDNFCPKCGTPVERDEEDVVDNGVVEFDPEKAPEETESLDLKWDVEDFHREEKTEDVEIEWGDLLGTKKAEEDAKKALMDMVDEAAKPVETGDAPIGTSVFETPEAAEIEKKVAEDKKPEEDQFDTFNAKNKEFQELLEKEKARVQVAKEERAKRLEELGLAEENKEIELADEEEGKLTVAERIKKRREERAKRDATQIIEPVLPLKLDQDEISGSWPLAPEKTAEPEVKKEEVPVPEVKEEEVPVPEVKDDPAVEAMKKGQTQQISREDFAAFLKQAEEQFGFEDIDEDIEEEPPVVEEPAEVPEEPVEEPPVVEEPAEPVTDVAELEDIPAAEEPETECEEVTVEEVPAAVTEEPAEVLAVPVEEPKAEEAPVPAAEEKTETDSFWSDEDEEEYEEKKGGKFLTFLIVLLAIILALQIAVLVIRFQFPDSQIAGIIEPVMTKIEDWIRGLF